jgi:hypothetical protein
MSGDWAISKGIQYGCISPVAIMAFASRKLHERIACGEKEQP